MTPPALTSGHALFLDIDGTVIDLAPSPDAVAVPPGLADALARRRAELGGALAILSGRKLADIDRLIGADYACAAEHGAIFRGPDGIVAHRTKRLAMYDAWAKTLARNAARMPGVIIEKKQISLVVHYRRAPEHEAELGRLVETLVGAADDAVLLLAHCAFELKPRGGDKGDALAGFMEIPPFAGKIPVFVGDDVTDEPAIRKAIELGGAGLHVLRDFGGSPQKVRDWLR